MRNLTVLMMTIILLFSKSSVASEYGEFEGVVKAEWLSDGRKMKLLEEFAYIDQLGRRWLAPKGSEVDGASIPRFAWAIIGGPFEGRYRNASVVHDVECDRRERPWELVHEMFYNAMLAADVPNLKAKVMYAAVYHFGPRWGYTEKRIVDSSKVDSIIFEAKSLNPDSDVRITASPKPRDMLDKIVGESEKTEIEFVVTPKQKIMSNSEFEELKKKIESEDLGLDEIRNYRPSSEI